METKITEELITRTAKFIATNYHARGHFDSPAITGDDLEVAFEVLRGIFEVSVDEADFCKITCLQAAMDSLYNKKPK
jgi:hypothetical protein